MRGSSWRCCPRSMLSWVRSSRHRPRPGLRRFRTRSFGMRTGSRRGPRCSGSCCTWWPWSCWATCSTSSDDSGPVRAICAVPTSTSSARSPNTSGSPLPCGPAKSGSGPSPNRRTTRSSPRTRAGASCPGTRRPRRSTGTARTRSWGLRSSASCPSGTTGPTERGSPSGPRPSWPDRRWSSPAGARMAVSSRWRSRSRPGRRPRDTT
jgi:hypothetical protein